MPKSAITMRRRVYIGESNEFWVTPESPALPYSLFCPICLLKFLWNKYLKNNLKRWWLINPPRTLFLVFVLSSSRYLQWITFFNFLIGEDHHFFSCDTLWLQISNGWEIDMLCLYCCHVLQSSVAPCDPYALK